MTGTGRDRRGMIMCFSKFVSGLAAIALAAGVVAASPTQGLAQSQAQAAVPPANEAAVPADTLARELSRLTHARRQLLGMMPMIAGNVRQLMTATNPKLGRDFDEALPFIVGTMLNRATKFEELIVASYLRHFTRDELKTMVDFFTSDSGRKLVELQPLMTQELAQASEPMSREMSREFADLMRKELRKRGHGI